MSSKYNVKKRGFEKPAQNEQRKSSLTHQSRSKEEFKNKIPEDSLVAAANKGAMIRFNRQATTTALQTGGERDCAEFSGGEIPVGGATAAPQLYS
mmetsp:Transcript_122223/g.239952  ORF Transcript_122223/g.239952 Transcript_122223/m.239952 type:complete len:95 (-) Transcript_122223:500-784(-)